MREERKLVTVLFADVVGSTALADTSDPEVVRTLMGRYFVRVSQLAEANGGMVEKFAGDAVMVVFGVPTAHDDDAERAVRAALEIRDSVSEVSIRVGVNSGEAVTAVREDRQFMVSGDVVNVAARLQQAAEPGQVIVGAVTEELTRRVIEYRRLPSIVAKGKRDPVDAFMALAARSALPVQSRGVPGLRAPMIGRDRELRLILETFGRSVEDRRPHVFTLVGSPGIGKSRLVLEALAAPAMKAAQVLRGRCLPYGRGITYWPLFEALHQDLGLALNEQPERRRERLDERLGTLDVPALERPLIRERLAVILGIRGPEEAMPDIEAGRVGRELAWAFRRYLCAIAESRPVVFLIDDLQWAEDGLVEVVERVAERLVDVPILLLCVARPELLERRPGWSVGRADATTLTLDPLRPAEVATLVSSLLDIDSLSEDMRQRIVERSEGTPLFCEEVVGMLIEEGGLVRDGGTWRAAAGAAQVEVPRSIQAVLTARLDALVPAEKSLLQAASVVGERFRVEEVVEMTSDASKSAIESALRKGLLAEEERTGEIRFRHLLVRDTAYASIPKADRARLHELVAQRLETASADPRQFAEILAHHWDRALSLSLELRLDAGEVESRAKEALRWAFEMGRRARATGDVVALETALEIAHEAHDAAGSRENEGTTRLALLEADLCVARGDYAAARQAAATAADAAQASGDLLSLARARVVETEIAAFAGTGGHDESLILSRQAIKACRAIGDTAGALEARQFGAFVFWGDGRLTDFVAEETAIAEEARGIGDTMREAFAVTWIASAETLRGNTSAAGSALQRAAEMVDRHGLRALHHRVVLVRAQTALLEGRQDVAETEYLRMIAEGEEVGMTSHVITSLRYLGYGAFYRDDHESLARLAARALALSEASGERWNRSELYGQRARAALLGGDIAAADQLINLCFEWHREGDATARAEAGEHLGAIRSAQGRLVEAEEAHLMSVEAVADTEFNFVNTIATVGYAEFLAARGRAAEAGRILDEQVVWLRERGWHLFDSHIERTRRVLS
jgi:class 3 adenylate cyclase